MPEPANDELDFWNAFAEAYNASPGKRTVSAVDALIGDLAGKLGGAQVLDLACGAGRGSAKLAPEVGPDGSVLGVDLSDAMLRAARQEREHEQVSFEQGSAEAVPAEDAAFAHAFCNLGLMLFPDAPAALRELRRVVRPEGSLRVGVWGRPENSSMMTTAGEAARRSGAELAKPPRSNFYLGTAEALAGVAEGTGWAVTSSSYVTVRFPYASADDAASDLGLGADDPKSRLRDALPAESWPAFAAEARGVLSERLEAGDGALELEILVGVFGAP